MCSLFKFLLAPCLVVTFSHTASCVALNVTNCVYHGHRPTGVLRNVSVTPMGPCGSACTFKTNTSYTVIVNFHADVGSGYPKTEATLIAGLSRPIPLYKGDACGSSIHCPVHAGSDVKYVGNFNIPTVNTNTTSFVAKWLILGDGDRAMICFEFPFAITN